MAITRTFTDLTPAELATEFSGMFDHEQAEFFHTLGLITATWGGGGLGIQAISIANHLSPIGRRVVRELAIHLGADE